jgi:hypothetical protein
VCVRGGGRGQCVCVTHCDGCCATHIMAITPLHERQTECTESSSVLASTNPNTMASTSGGSMWTGEVGGSSAALPVTSPSWGTRSAPAPLASTTASCPSAAMRVVLGVSTEPECISTAAGPREAPLAEVATCRASHCVLWPPPPPSAQCTSRHSSEQYQTCCWQVQQANKQTNKR